MLSEYNPIPNKSAVICGEKFRFTILTSRLIRIEYSENGIFNDSATYMVVNRNFNTPEFTTEEKNEILKISTKHIQLTYHINKPFSQETLNVCYTSDNASVYAGRHLPEWRFGTTPARNLKGTATSLDNANGEIVLENGIMSMGEICVLDDSNSMSLNPENTLSQPQNKSTDMYLFCYGNSDGSNFSYLDALSDYYHLTGNVPMLPRYALGNWWCRYYPYTQEEYLNLMQKFQDNHIPLTVAMIDMDWHYTDIDKKYGGGWTGFSWNKDLFPNHTEFLKTLHNKGLFVGLNTHPQGGVAAHEERYTYMAKAMGISPETEEKIEFNIWDSNFAENYFKILHHPLEDEGVDFWWIDYNTKIRELTPDPLPPLNHYHYTDSKRKAQRPLILSRYAGPGSHRYPVGFSGDSISSWESLKFQPQFTATASNIGYVWWSHDIGGFQGGKKDDELIARWVQLGTFSPINRLHSMNLRYMSKEPWNYNKICEASIKKFLNLRHQLIPYTYTMNYRTAFHNEPLIKPLYYKYTGSEAYRNKTEFLFGTEMIVSPIVQPKDDVTSYANAKVYLPDGIWYDFFTGRKYQGNREFTAFRDIDTCPVFVKSGGIIPMSDNENTNDISNPETLKIKVFAGANGYFELYEDDGISNEYQNGKFALTKMTLDWCKKPVLRIEKPKGDTSVIPSSRNYIIELVGVNDCDVTVKCGNILCDYQKSCRDNIIYITVSNISEDLSIQLENSELSKNDVYKWLDKFLMDCSAEYMLKEAIYNNLTKDIPLTEKLIYIGEKIQDQNLRLALQEIITNP